MLAALGLALLHSLRHATDTSTTTPAPARTSTVTRRRSAARPLAAFGIGLVHGTAISMGLASSLFGQLLGGARGRRSIRAAIPALGALSLAFGVLYGLAALGGA